MKTSSRRILERGQALVEGALILVVALALLLGIFDLGQIMFIHQTLVERTRSAARWGAVNTYNQTSIQNLVLYGTAAPGQGAQPIFNLTPSNVNVQHLNAGTAEDSVSVTVSGYQVDFFSAAFVPMLTGQSGQSVKRQGMTVQITVPYEVAS